MKLKYIGNRPESMSCVSHPRLEKGPYNFVKRVCEVDAKDAAFLLEQNPRSFEAVPPEKTVPPTTVPPEKTVPPTTVPPETK
jgi:hypothetical protein